MRRRNPARWRAIEARLSRESTIWLATVRQDGRPHLVPVWFIWLDGKIYIAVGIQSQKYVNISYNQSVALSLPDTTSVILIEGLAYATDGKAIDTLADHFYNKYEWDFRYDDTNNWKLLVIAPHKILAWGDNYDAEGTRVL